jgi:NAD(P)-dependent dehydrogenase (short-subunit alcohol dehydrogenase family)
MISTKQLNYKTNSDLILLKYKPMMDMKEKTAIITGANAGIGKYTTLGLVKNSIQVVMAVRNTDKGGKAKKEVLRKYPEAKISVYHCDLSSFASVHRFSKKIHEHFNEIDLLINNAGAFFMKYAETEDGFERQWQINHLSHFLLTQFLIDLLRRSGNARIINVSSSSHYRGKLNLPDPNLKDNYHGLKAYGQSKLANVLFTNALASRLNPKKITANSLHPGAIRTSIGSKHLNIFGRLFWFSTYPTRKSPNKGAKTSVYLATDPSVDDVSGNYFDDKKPVTPSKRALDEDLQERLWKLSLKQTQVDDRISK